MQLISVIVPDYNMCNMYTNVEKCGEKEKVPNLDYEISFLYELFSYFELFRSNVSIFLIVSLLLYSDKTLPF